MLDAPFKIGQVYWAISPIHRKENVQCPMCLGEKRVTVHAGRETYEVECDSCRAGYLGPQGVVTQYVNDPDVCEFKIAEIAEWTTDRGWRVKSTTGDVQYFHELFSDKDEAMKAAIRHVAEYNEEQWQHTRKKKYGHISTWSIQYHLKEIKENERKIEWHRDKIRQKKDADADS